MLGKLNTDQVDAVLTANITGRIGCTDGTQVYVVPVSYAFNGDYLIAQSKEGMKIDLMRAHSQVCFQVDEIDDYANWRSVVTLGKLRRSNRAQGAVLCHEIPGKPPDARKGG